MLALLSTVALAFSSPTIYDSRSLRASGISSAATHVLPRAAAPVMIDVADLTSNTAVIGAVAVLGLGGGGYVLFQQQQEAAEQKKREEFLRRKAIQKAEEDRDKLAGQVALVVPIIVGFGFFAFISKFA